MPFASPVTTPLQGPTERAPVARLSVNETADEITVEADASASSDPEKDSVSYQFDWGDGTLTAYQTTATATHTYDNSGTYNVSVNVRNESGLTDTATRQIGTFRTENREVSLSASGAVSTTRFPATNSFLSIDATKSLPRAKSNATAQSTVSLSGTASLVSVANASAGGTAVLLAIPELVATHLAKTSGEVDVGMFYGVSTASISTATAGTALVASPGIVPVGNATARSSLDVNANTGLVPVSVATAEGDVTLLADLDHVAVQIAQASSQTELRGVFGLSAQNIATFNERLEVEVGAGRLVTSGRATVRSEVVLETDSIISSTSTLVILRRPDLRQVFVPHQKREIIVPDTDDEASAK
jgi:PKD repeat protein